MSCPPPEAYDVARAALKIAFEDRDVGITYFYIWLEDSDDLVGSKYETLMVNDKELVQTAV